MVVLVVVLLVGLVVVLLKVLLKVAGVAEADVDDGGEEGDGMSVAVEPVAEASAPGGRSRVPLERTRDRLIRSPETEFAARGVGATWVGDAELVVGAEPISESSLLRFAKNRRSLNSDRRKEEPGGVSSAAKESSGGDCGSGDLDKSARGVSLMARCESGGVVATARVKKAM